MATTSKSTHDTTADLLKPLDAAPTEDATGQDQDVQARWQMRSTTADTPDANGNPPALSIEDAG